MRIDTFFETVLASMTYSRIDTIKAFIVLGFSILVAIAFLVSLGCMVYFRYVNPGADIGLWVNVFLTCLGYVVGILTGLLGLSAPGAAGPQSGSTAPARS